MVRTQIQLSDEQAERLRRVAAAQGMSLSAVIREAIDAVGRFASGQRDVSAEHDRELADAYRG